MAIGTEHGFAITFATQGGTWKLMNVGGHEESREKVPTFHHGSTNFKTYMPSDLMEPGEYELEVQFEGASGLPVAAAAETITVTHPKGVGESTAATVAGSGFVVKRKFPDGQAGNAQLKRGKVTIAWDGVTGPSFTPAT